MEALLAKEFLAFTPLSGTFDIAAVEREIATLGFWFRDEADPTRFVVTNDQELRDEFQRRRREDPDSPFPYVLLIRLTPERIVVTPSTFDDEKLLTRAFVTWLLATYPCRITNDYGIDLTPLAAAD